MATGNIMLSFLLFFISTLTKEGNFLRGEKNGSPLFIFFLSEAKKGAANVRERSVAMHNTCDSVVAKWTSGCVVRWGRMWLW